MAYGCFVKPQIGHHALELDVFFPEPLQSLGSGQAPRGADRVPPQTVTSAAPVLRQLLPSVMPPAARLDATAIRSTVDRFFGIWPRLCRQNRARTHAVCRATKLGQDQRSPS